MEMLILTILATLFWLTIYIKEYIEYKKRKKEYENIPPKKSSPTYINRISFKNISEQEAVWIKTFLKELNSLDRKALDVFLYQYFNGAITLNKVDKDFTKEYFSKGYRIYYKSIYSSIIFSSASYFKKYKDKIIVFKKGQETILEMCVTQQGISVHSLDYAVCFNTYKWYEFSWKLLEVILILISLQYINIEVEEKKQEEKLFKMKEENNLKELIDNLLQENHPMKETFQELKELEKITQENEELGKLFEKNLKRVYKVRSKYF